MISVVPRFSFLVCHLSVGVTFEYCSFFPFSFSFLLPLLFLGSAELYAFVPQWATVVLDGGGGSCRPSSVCILAPSVHLLHGRWGLFSALFLFYWLSYQGWVNFVCLTGVSLVVTLGVPLFLETHNPSSNSQLITKQVSFLGLMFCCFVWYIHCYFVQGPITPPPPFNAGIVH